MSGRAVSGPHYRTGKGEVIFVRLKGEPRGRLFQSRWLENRKGKRGAGRFLKKKQVLNANLYLARGEGEKKTANGRPKEGGSEFGPPPHPEEREKQRGGEREGGVCLSLCNIPSRKKRKGRGKGKNWGHRCPLFLLEEEEKEGAPWERKRKKPRFRQTQDIVPFSPTSSLEKVEGGKERPRNFPSRKKRGAIKNLLAVKKRKKKQKDFPKGGGKPPSFLVRGSGQRLGSSVSRKKKERILLGQRNPCQRAQPRPRKKKREKVSATLPTRKRKEGGGGNNKYCTLWEREREGHYRGGEAAVLIVREKKRMRLFPKGAALNGRIGGGKKGACNQFRRPPKGKGGERSDAQEGTPPPQGEKEGPH